MDDRIVLHIANKGLFISPYPLEELYIGENLNLERFRKTECLSQCTFAEALVAGALKGSLNTTEWKQQYPTYIQERIFATYDELQSLVRILTNPIVAETIGNQTKDVLCKFFVFYNLIYAYEEHILSGCPWLFFDALFYPSRNDAYKDIDIYNQYNKYGLQGFSSAIFYYTINKTAFDLLHINSSEVGNLSILQEKIEKIQTICTTEIESLNLNTARDQLNAYKEYELRRIRNEHISDITFNEQEGKNILYQSEVKALENLQGSKNHIPLQLYGQLETTQRQVIDDLGREYHKTEIQAESPLIVHRPDEEAVKGKRGAPVQYLFIQNKNEENQERKEQERKRLTTYMAKHKLNSTLLTASNDNLNKVIVCFCKIWQQKGWIKKEPATPALLRFIRDDCGIESTITDKTWAGAMRKMLKEEPDNEIYYDVKTCFENN